MTKRLKNPNFRLLPMIRCFNLVILQIGQNQLLQKVSFFPNVHFRNMYVCTYNLMFNVVHIKQHQNMFISIDVQTIYSYTNHFLFLKFSFTLPSTYDVTHILTYSLTHLTFSFFSHFSIVCESSRTFLTVLSSVKEAISDGCCC